MFCLVYSYWVSIVSNEICQNIKAKPPGPKIELPSAIQQMLWAKRVAAPGDKVGLEIFTHYVGNKSELKIEFTDQSGKTLGNYSDKMSGKYYLELNFSD